MLKKIFSFFILFFLSLQLQAQDDGIYIRVTDAQVKKSLIALTPLLYTGTASQVRQHQKHGADLFNVIQNNLEVSSFFEFIRPQAFLEDTSKVGLRPAPQFANGFSFENWRKIGAEFLFRAGYQVVSNRLEIEVYLYHVPRANVVLAKKYTGSLGELRTLAHTISNDIVESLTKRPGMFLSQVVLVSDRGGNRWKEIYTMDWDGHNLQPITNHRSVSISPNWSPDGKSITYTSFAQNRRGERNADLFLYEIDTKRRFSLSSRTGINSGSAFAPNGRDIYFTMSQGGTPDIYKIDTNGRGLQQITRGPAGAMNVEPTVSPDGRQIAFSSDRSGRPMIYTMDIDGKNVKRLTFAGRYNASPAWSPDGKRIAFAGFDKSHFDIFVMDADGTNMSRLTSARKANGTMANNENPSFSPDGRHVMFTSDRDGKKQIYIVNIDGTNERRITADNHNYEQPRWIKK